MHHRFSHIVKSAIAGVLLFCMPLIASAHEVYVLTQGEIAEGVSTPPFNEINLAFADISQFALWGLIAVLTVFIVFGISIIRPLERLCAPLFDWGRQYAALIARVTVGISFLAAAYYGATYGPELPIEATYGAYAIVIRGLLLILGIMVIFGVRVRIAAIGALALFSIATYFHGIYMLTYTNYLGEIIALLILGHHRGTAPRPSPQIAKAFAPYSFALLRVCFGISLFYASFYAKILHNDLALQVASLPLAGHLTSIASVLGFEPHFLVLGAAIVEIVIALFFIFGIEIRFTSLFLLFWLSLSLLYFGEVVWPHIILIGIPIAFIFYGYDKYSIEGFFFKKDGREPVL